MGSVSLNQVVRKRWLWKELGKSTAGRERVGAKALGQGPVCIHAHTHNTFLLLIKRDEECVRAHLLPVAMAASATSHENRRPGNKF